jgi:sugar/nucleoside kinase (ribokinase family)
MTSENDPLWPGPAKGSELDVVGLGECSLDRVVTIDSFPASGDKLSVAQYVEVPGGQIATALRTCCRLGLRAGFVGCVGDDEAARQVLEPLREAGIDLVEVRSIPGAATRAAVILVEIGSGERTVLWHRDPLLKLDPKQLDRRSIERAGALLVDATDPEAAEWAARVARAAGIPVVLDADRIWDGAEALLGCVDFPVVSQPFAEEFGGDGSVRAGLRALLLRGARLAVATLGEWGAVALAQDASFESPGFEVNALDTTGAGDAFRGGFIWALLRRLDGARVLRTANAVAGLACEATGAQGGLPSEAATEALLRSRQPRAWPSPEPWS